MSNSNLSFLKDESNETSTLMKRIAELELENKGLKQGGSSPAVSG